MMYPQEREDLPRMDTAQIYATLSAAFIDTYIVLL